MKTILILLALCQMVAFGAIVTGPNATANGVSVATNAPDGSALGFANPYVLEWYNVSFDSLCTGTALAVGDGNTETLVNNLAISTGPGNQFSYPYNDLFVVDNATNFIAGGTINAATTGNDSTNFMFAFSYNLVDWTFYTNNVSGISFSAGVNHTWGPKLSTNIINGGWVIWFAACTNYNVGGGFPVDGFSTYYVTNNDATLTNWSAAKRITITGETNVFDFCSYQIPTTTNWLMVYKNVTDMYLCLALTTNGEFSTYTPIATNNWAGWSSAAESPSLVFFSPSWRRLYWRNGVQYYSDNFQSTSAFASNPTNGWSDKKIVQNIPAGGSSSIMFMNGGSSRIQSFVALSVGRQNVFTNIVLQNNSGGGTVPFYMGGPNNNGSGFLMSGTQWWALRGGSSGYIFSDVNNANEFARWTVTGLSLEKGSFSGGGSGLTNIPSVAIVGGGSAHTPTAVTVGASPFNFTNTTPNYMEVYVTDTAAFSVTKHGTQIAASLTSDTSFALQPTNYCTITYASTTPTMSTNAW